MPDFTFTSPEGKTYTLSGPEGATREQAATIFRQQHPELFQGQSGTTTGGTAPTQPTQPTQPRQPAAPASGQIFGLGPTREQVPIRTQDMPDPAAAVAHGLISVPVEAGRLANAWGAQPLGWDLSKLVPPSMQRGYERLTGEANKGGGSQLGESIGSALPFLATGGLSELPWAGRVLTRSVLPSLLQPTTGPVDATTKALQTLFGTGIGEGLHGLGWLAGTPLGKWAAAQAKSIADKAREDTAAVRDQLQRVMTGRTSQLSETATRTAARDTEEQTRQRAFSAAQTEYQRQAQAAAEVEARNQARQQVVDRLNQRNTLDYAGRQAQAAANEVRRLDTPRQATQGLLNDARGLIGLRPLEYNLTRESAPQTLREVGGELDRIYRQMSFDPNQSGFMQTAARTQASIRTMLRQDPAAQALWDRVFQGKALMPGLRAEAGQLPGWDVKPPGGLRGQLPSVMREPAERGPSLPMGTRSGPVSGDQLALMMSTLTKAQQEFGLEAQRGGGTIYRNIAAGLADMRQSIESQLDRQFPTLAEQRELANQAYFLTSRVMDKIDVHGVATPEGLLEAFKAAEGDTRFGTDRRYADIKDRLGAQHRDFTAKPDKPTPPTPVKGYNEPVPRVGKEPTPPEPVPPTKPVPLVVPKSTRATPPATRTDERLPAEAARVAGEAASHLGRVTGIPLLGPVVRGVARAGKPAAKAVLRPVRDVSRAAATPAAILTSQGVAGVADQQRRRREERQRNQ